MKQTTDQFAPFLPWLGLLLLIAGAVAYFVTRRFELITNLLLGLGVLSLALYAILRPDDVRELTSGRQARYGTSTLLSIIFFFAIGVLAYYIGYQNNDWRIDATETDQFTPLPETVALLESLTEPVHVKGFYTFQFAGQQQQIEAILQSMQAVTDQLTYEFINPLENPLQAEKYELSGNGTLVFTRGSGEDEVFSKTVATSERELHSALLRVINPVVKTAYFLTGHGELDPEAFGAEGVSSAVSVLENSGFNVEPLNLLITGSVPEDATIIAVLGQQAPLAPEEAAAIRTYLNEGGAAFIARDIVIGIDGGLLAGDDDLNTMLLEDWGITIRRDIIIDIAMAQAGQGIGAVFLGAEYGNSPITVDLNQYGTIFNAARSIGTQDTANVTTIDLVMTNENAWGESNLAALEAGEYGPDEADFIGQMAVGVSAQNLSTDARLVVFGDADFINNGGIVQGGNGLLFLDALNWLADDVVTIDLTAREVVDRQVVMTDSQLNLLRFVSICLTPGFMAIIGFGVWFSRRQRK